MSQRHGPGAHAAVFGKLSVFRPCIGPTSSVLLLRRLALAYLRKKHLRPCVGPQAKVFFLFLSHAKSRWPARSGRRAQKPKHRDIAHHTKHHQHRNGCIHGRILPFCQTHSPTCKVASRRGQGQPHKKRNKHHHSHVTLQRSAPVAMQKRIRTARDAAAGAIQPCQGMKQARHAKPCGLHPGRIAQPGSRQRAQQTGKLFPSGRTHIHTPAPPAMPFTSLCSRAHTIMSSPSRLRIRYKMPVLLLYMPHCCFTLSSLSPAL